MNANDLLFLLSAKGEGTWQQFRSSVERLAIAGGALEPIQPREANGSVGTFPLHRQLEKNLRRLAHVEFFSAGYEEGWRTAPAVLAISKSDQGWNGLLCGARTSAMIQSLRDAAGPYAYEQVPQPDAPDVCKLVAESADALAGAAHIAGVYVQLEAPAAILSVLPPLTDVRNGAQVELPFGLGWQVQRFSPRELAWCQSSRDEALKTSSGLFRFFSRFPPKQHFLCRRGKAFRIPQQLGKYFVLRRARVRRGILSYQQASQALRVKAICQPPLLIDRALSLCTGLAPEFDAQGRCLIYRGVNSSIARSVSNLLGQEF